MTTCSTMWYKIARYLCRVSCLIFLNYRLYGVRRLPRRGGVLLAANHQSYLDPVLFAIGLPRPLHFMARDSLFRNPLFGLLIGSLNAFPVRRGGADRRAVRHALELLKAGEVVLMFPESTRTMDGTIGNPQGGLSMIAARAGVPIVPAAVEGAFQAWPRYRLLPHPARVRAHLGRALYPADFSALSHKETAALLKERLLELQGALASKPNL